MSDSKSSSPPPPPPPQPPTANNGSGISSSKPWTIVIHGGAGTIDPGDPEREKRFLRQIELALQKARTILMSGGGGSALDAVEAAVRHLEDSPLYNAGRGSVYTSEYTHELDASIMDGATKKAGAVCAVKHTKNPISAARLVMTRSVHVMLCGAGADQFAKEHGLEVVENSYFDTKRRRKQIDTIIAKQKAFNKAANAGGGKGGGQPVPEQKLVVLDHSGASLVQRNETATAGAASGGGEAAAAVSVVTPPTKVTALTTNGTAGTGSSGSGNGAGGDRTKANSHMIGTVGAVALDQHGNVAAATSTGGMTNKSYGRVGDSPIIGAGTYADNRTCAVSCTGYGEYFMRAVVAHGVHAAMLYGKQSLHQAASSVMGEWDGYGADFTGGFVGVDAKSGVWTAPHNSTGMYKGVITSIGEHKVGIWHDGEEKKGWISGDQAINAMIASIPPPTTKKKVTLPSPPQPQHAQTVAGPSKI